MNKKKVSDETKEKMRIAHIGKKHSQETKKKMSRTHKKKVTQEQRDRMRDIQKLSTNLRSIKAREHLRNKHLVKKEWDGTLKSLRYRTKRHFKYNIWREKVKENNNFCEICKTTEDLIVHHKISIDKIIRDNINKIINYDFNIPILWDPKNGQVLCKDCHRNIHNIGSLKKSKKTRMISLLKLIIKWDSNKNILDKDLKNNIILEISKS